MTKEKAIEKAIEKAFNKANLIGEDADLWGIIYGYKALRELSDEEQETIYNDLADRLGFTW